MELIKIIPLPPDAPPFIQPDVDVSAVKRQYLDVPYAGTDNPNQMMDIFLPEEGDGPFPTLIQFHGGAFVGGHKRDAQCVYLFNGLLRGYAVVNVNYRLLPEIVFPEAVFDVKAAVRFLRANAEKYCLDPTRFAVSGDSAGAYFAAMLGTTAGNAALEDPSMGAAGYDTSVQAVIGLFGLYDAVLTSQFTEDMPPMPDGTKLPNFMDEFAGTNCRENPKLAALVSPISYVAKDCPPVLIQAGTDDEIVGYQTSVDFVNHVNEVCGEGHAILSTIQGAMHGDPAYESEEYERERFEFLDRILKPEK